MATNPNNIAGIYNYCDRWCERCNFTSRCAVYTNEEGLSPEEKDLNNKAFWDNIANSLANAVAQLQDIAAERGITIPDENDEATNEYITNVQNKDREMEQHPLLQYSGRYMMEATEVLKNNEALQEKSDELNQLIELDAIDLNETKREVVQLHEYFEIVQWYLFQIKVKFMRALSSLAEPGDEASENDSNGSAKVALIAADRSIIAWQHIMQWLPTAQDDIIPLLGLLQKIRTLGEHRFPNARAFVRVGLDE